jgi:hypothetical protein
MTLRTYENGFVLVATLALSFAVAACTEKPRADQPSDAAVEDARRAAWIPRHSPPAQTGVTVGELSSSNGIASVAEPITAPALEVGGTSTQFDIIRIVPTDVSNTTYAIALSPRCPGNLQDARLRVGHRNWRPTSVEESSSYCSGDWSNQRTIVFSLPANLAREFAVHAGTDLVRLREDAFDIGASTRLDSDRTSATEVWIAVTIANKGAEPVLMLDPAGVWKAQDGEDLRVVVLHGDKDVTHPAQGPGAAYRRQWSSQAVLRGPFMPHRLQMSRLPAVRGRIAVPVEITPLPNYQKAPPSPYRRIGVSAAWCIPPSLSVGAKTVASRWSNRPVSCPVPARLAAQGRSAFGEVRSYNRTGGDAAPHSAAARSCRASDCSTRWLSELSRACDGNVGSGRCPGELIHSRGDGLPRAVTRPAVSWFTLSADGRGRPPDDGPQRVDGAVLEASVRTASGPEPSCCTTPARTA